MLCVRCGQKNSKKSNSCGSCGAVLPRNYGEADTSSTLSLEDGRNYDPPDRVYPNTAIQALEDALAVYLDEDGPEDPVWDALEEMERRIAQLLTFLPQAAEAIAAQKEADPDDLPHRIGYLLQVGVQRFNDATEKFGDLLEGDGDDFDDVLDELQLSNDFICHAAFLVGELFSRDGMTVSLVQVDENGVEIPYVPEDEADSEESELNDSDA